MTDPSGDGVRQALAYHQRTKHHLHRYARGPGYLDWETQPDPFRTFAVCPPWSCHCSRTGWPPPTATSTSPAPLPPGRWNGTRWPSSSSWLLASLRGNSIGARAGRCAVTPPAEISIPRRVTPCFRPCPAWRRASTITSAATTFSNAAAPLRELRRTGSPSTCLTARSSSACPQSTGARAWKYGERAFRYCQHDVGHALAALRYAAAALGWSAVLLDTWSDDDLAGLFGLDRDDDFAAVEAADREFPDAALLLNTRGPGTAERPDVSAELVRDGTWAGEANRLSPAHVQTGP